MIYLDNSATTRQHALVTQEMLKYMEQDFGNPSSLHRMGLTAEKAMRAARETLAKSLDVSSEELYFTSGGTASDNMAIIGTAEALKRKGNHIITTKIEHPAVLEAFKYLASKGFEVTYLDVEKDGHLDPALLESTLTEKTILVSVMHVNNELGTIQPIEEIGNIIKAKTSAIFHCDAVQSFGKIKIPLAKAKIDLLSASSHKIHGPKGMGLLYMKKGCRIEPLLHGGGQEKDVVPGTENMPGIIGFATAAKMALEERQSRFDHVSRLRSKMAGILTEQIENIKINGSAEQGSPYILSVSFSGTRGEVLLHMLEKDEIYVSTGSACQSNKKGKSHVLSAVRLTPDEIEGTLRFSFSADNTEEEIDFAAEKVKKAALDMRRVLRGR